MPEDENVFTKNEDDNTENNNEEEDNNVPTPNPLGKLERSALIHYIATDFDFTSATPTAPTAANWYLLGADIEDMSVELNPDTETMKNILDESNVQDNGYEPSIDVDTYYAKPTDGAIYTHLKDIMMNRKKGDSCRTYILEILVDNDGTTFDAWVEEIIVKPTSYGGAQGGVRIPFNISFAGNRQQGTATITNKVPAFTATT